MYLSTIVTGEILRQFNGVAFVRRGDHV